MKKNYTVYHLHTDKSNVGSSNGADSVTTYTQYLDKAVELGMKAISISEHGNLLGWYNNMLEARNRGLKYIIGMEAYVTAHKDKEKGLIRDNNHFGIYAKNDEGRKELLRLSSKSYEKESGGFYYNPRISVEEIMNTSDNIILTTACLGSPIWQLYRKAYTDDTKKPVTPEERDEAEQQLEDWIDFLTENKHRVFLEVQYHNVDEQYEYNRFLARLSAENGIPLIAGSDTHALSKEHAEARKVLLQSKNATYGNEDDFDLTFKSYDEFRKAFIKQGALTEAMIDQAIENTNAFADMIEEYDVSIENKYPRLFDNPIKLFTQAIHEGFIERGIDKLSDEKQKEYKKRINEEFEVYKELDAIDFMLLQKIEVNDWCRTQGIATGYGRGSVSGSVIAYLIGITEMDAIKHKLSFGRFMNRNRISLADIDSDIDSERRHELIKHISEVSGIYFSEIITYNKMALKQAIKDAGRGLGMENHVCDDIASNCDEKSEDKTNENRYRQQYPELFKYVDVFNGVIKSVGSHPSGFVVSPIPLDENMGTMYTKESLYPVSQINMKEIDAQNYVKLDLLGLNNVTIIDKACKVIGIPFITPDTIDDEDMDVWRSMREDTLGVFQMESASAQQYLKLLFRDTTIEKLREGAPELKMMSLLSIANGAIRPSGNSYRYDLSSGITKSYGHEALDKMMAETGSYMVFQETINRFLVEFCGFTESNADSVRRGLAKKSGTEQFLPEIEKGFLATMTETYGDTSEHAQEILEGFLQVIADASDYAFSLNHSQSYSYIGYACAWLKYYYPVEFLTAILNSTPFSKKEKISEIMSLSKRKNVTINPIKFGKSGALYEPDLETHSIYKGVESISYMNTLVANQLLELAKANNYEKFTDVLVAIQEKTNANSGQLEILIRLDYFQQYGSKYILLKIWNYFNKMYKKTLVEKTKIKRLEWIKEVERMLYCLPYENETIEQQIEYERLKLGYPMTTFPQIDETLYYVLDIDKKYTPKIMLYRLSDGEETLVKMKKGKFYVRASADSLYNDASAIYKGDVIRLTDTSQHNGVKKDANGEWVKTENIETFIEGFRLVRKSKERKLVELVE